MDLECNVSLTNTTTACGLDTSPTDGSHSRAPLLFSHLEVAVIYISLSSLLSILGIIGNCLVIYVVIKEMKMNQHFKCFLVNGAIADLCVAGVANPLCIAGAILGMQSLTRHYWLCTLIATMCLTSCVCVFLNFTSLTINRWFFICHNKQYTSLYGKIRIVSVCIFCWVIGFIAVIPTFLGWGGHAFDMKSHQCIWDRTADRSYTLFVAIGLVTTPFLITGFCNVAIFARVIKVKREIGAFLVKERNALINSVRTVKTLVVTYFVYLICWTPYVFVLILDHSDTFSLDTHLFVTLLAHSHSVTPFFVYIACNRRFKEILWKRLAIFRNNRVQPLVDIRRNTARHTTISGKPFRDVNPESTMSINPSAVNRTRVASLSSRLTINISNKLSVVIGNEHK